jgi:type IV pilus assembly protein PilV
MNMFAQMQCIAESRLPRRLQGFTLIETMVALLVISVGMIGVAALHGQALSASGTAIRRSLAVGLASDIADRIRVNRGAQLAYEGAASDNNCDDPTGGGGVDCSPAQMAAHDLFLWQTQVAQTLPGGTGAVDVDNATNPTTYAVTVSWDEPTQGAPVTFTFAFELPIY